MGIMRSVAFTQGHKSVVRRMYLVSHASPWNFIQGSGNISILKSVPRQDSGASNDIHDLAVAMDYIIVEREKKCYFCCSV